MKTNKVGRKNELQKIHKIWDDCDCFIFGGGYSVIRQFGLDPKLAPTTKEEYLAFGDLIKPYFEGKKVIGVNNAFMLGDWIDVAFWGDSAQYFRYKNLYDAFSGLKITCHPSYKDKAYKGIKFIPRYPKRKTGLTNKRKYVVWNFNSGSCAVNLARHLGAKRIFLLGFDMYTDPEYNRTHWHSGYMDKRNTPTVRDLRKGKRQTIRVKGKDKLVKPPYSRHMKGFFAMALHAKTLGLEIINLSPDSKVEDFPKAKVFDYLAEPVKAHPLFGGNIPFVPLSDDLRRVAMEEDDEILSDS